MVVLCRILY